MFNRRNKPTGKQRAGSGVAFILQVPRSDTLIAHSHISEDCIILQTRQISGNYHGVFNIHVLHVSIAVVLFATNAKKNCHKLIMFLRILIKLFYGILIFRDVFGNAKLFGNGKIHQIVYSCNQYITLNLLLIG